MSMRLFLLLLFAAALSANPVWAEHRLGGDFTLRNTKGVPVSLSSLKGRVVLLYFGFTYCPDMCPTELLRFRNLLDSLPAEQRQQVQPLFVSIDPRRDTPEVLNAYVANFGQDILALTGTESELRRVARQYGASFRYVRTGAGYTVDHSTGTYLIDREGRLVRILPFGMPFDVFRQEVVRLLQ